MSYSDFMKSMSEDVSASLEKTSGLKEFREYIPFEKAINFEKESMDYSSIARDFGLSDSEMKMAVKIAKEIESISHSLRLTKVQDSDYANIMKTAGCEVDTERVVPEIGSLFSSSIQKLACNAELSQMEEMYIGTDFFQKVSGIEDMALQKKAGLADRLVSLGKKMGAKEVVKKPYLGSIGSYALAGAPIAAGAAYLKGKSSGKEKAKQEIANEIAEKLRSMADQ